MARHAISPSQLKIFKLNQNLVDIDMSDADRHPQPQNIIFFCVSFSDGIVLDVKAKLGCDKIFFFLSCVASVPRN